MGLRAFDAGLAACSAAAVVAQAQAVAVQQAQQQGSGLAAGLAALGYGGSPLGALGSPAQLQSTGTDPRSPKNRSVKSASLPFQASSRRPFLLLYITDRTICCMLRSERTRFSLVLPCSTCEPSL